MEVNIENMRYWPILNYLPASLLKDIRLVYVFGHAGSDVLLVTHDDELLIFGFNSLHCLGDEQYESQYDIKSLKKIEALSKKRIKGFAFSTGLSTKVFVLACLESGEVYSWGYHPSNRTIFKHPSLIDSLPKTVTEVACGIGHVLALTSDGQVFAWGDNSKKQVSNLNEAVISVPVKISGALLSQRVVKISCGSHFSVVVTSDGIMYSWGENDKGQLGINTVSQFEDSPREISLKDTCVKQIACGSNHVLALDTNGYLFSWGCNDCKQLGFEDIKQQSVPSSPYKETRYLDFCFYFSTLRMQSMGSCQELPLFKEVAASVNLSVAVTFGGVVNVWGKAAGECNSDCIPTPCRTIDEAFALFNCGKMYKPIEITSNNETLSGSIRKSFGNQESCDFTFIVEGKEIHVHRTILKLRSQYFERMFQEHWLEAKKSSAEINEDYKAMVAFLKYLYTDELQVDSRLALEVSVIADKYCESNLINVCLQKFERGLNVANVAQLYERACETKMKSFSDLCINFAAYNLKGVVKSEGFHQWKNDTYRSFFGQDKITEACGK